MDAMDPLNHKADLPFCAFTAFIEAGSSKEACLMAEFSQTTSLLSIETESSTKTYILM